MIIHNLNNYGTIQEIHDSNVYITPQGIILSAAQPPKPAVRAEKADVAEEAVTVPATAAEPTLDAETDDERHARCIRTLFDMTGSKGRPLVTYSSQWTAIYRILVDFTAILRSTWASTDACSSWAWTPSRHPARTMP